MGRYDGEDYTDEEYARRRADREGKTPAEVCSKREDHKHIRGRSCDGCGTYFRGDDCG